MNFEAIIVLLKDGKRIRLKTWPKRCFIFAVGEQILDDNNNLYFYGLDHFYQKHKEFFLEKGDWEECLTPNE